MRTIIISLILILSVITSSFAGTGLLADYKVNGTAIGDTTLQGNLKVMMKPKLKRITGNIFYQEAGNPFPDLDEKEVIVNYKKSKKHLYTSGAGEWFSSPLSDDGAMINANQVTITVTKTPTTKPKEIKAYIKLNLPTAMGGNQSYRVKFTYDKRTPDNTDKKVKEIGNPTAVDLLSVFIENEKIIELLSKKLPTDNFRVPKTFSVVWKKGKTKQLSVRATLSMKSNIDFPNSYFAP